MSLSGRQVCKGLSVPPNGWSEFHECEGLTEEHGAVCGAGAAKLWPRGMVYKAATASADLVCMTQKQSPLQETPARFGRPRELSALQEGSCVLANAIGSGRATWPSPTMVLGITRRQVKERIVRGAKSGLRACSQCMPCARGCYPWW